MRDAVIIDAVRTPISLADVNDPRWAEPVMGGYPRLVAL